MIENKVTKRIEYIDIMKAVAIILVILGHMNNANGSVKAIIYSFHMPLFFFIYGLTVKIRENYTLKELKKIFISRSYSLLIPYFLWAFLYSGISIDKIPKIIYGSYQTIIEAGSLSSLWFLTCMFASVIVFECIMYFINKIKTRINVNIILILIYIPTVIASSIIPLREIKGYPFCLDASICALSFIILGFLARNIKIKRIENKIAKISILIITIIVFMMGVFLYKFNIIQSEGYILMAKARYGNYVLFTITAISGSCLVMIISKILEKILNKKIKDMLIFIGQNTFIIFVVHKLFIQYLINSTNIKLPEILILIIYTIIVLILSLIVAIIIDKLIPVLSGKQKFNK